MYDPLYIAYLVYFNRDRDYFECHEVLEELWLAKDKDPRYKGLLQIAVGLFHFRNSNVRGAVKMMNSALERLQSYPPYELGIDLHKLREEVREYVSKLENYREAPFSYKDLTIEIADPLLSQSVQEASRNIKPNIPQRRKPQRPQRAGDPRREAR